MRLNTIQPAEGAQLAPLGVGRGACSWWVNSAGRGHFGQ